MVMGKLATGHLHTYLRNVGKFKNAKKLHEVIQDHEYIIQLSEPVMGLIIFICIYKCELTVSTFRLTCESWYSFFDGFLFVFLVICYEDNLQLILC